MNRTTVFSIGLLLTLAAACPGQVTITEFALKPGSGSPQWITAGPDGALWFTEFDLNAGINKIGRIAPNGTITEYPLAAGSGPQGIAAGPDGALWFTEALGNRIGRITTLGAITEFPTLPAQALPYAITDGPDGALWFTEGGGGKIGRITTSGVVTEFAVPTVGAGPTGITKGPDGALWFTESFASNIGRITTSGVLTEFALPTVFSGRQDITAGPDGNLWFTEQDLDNIGRITTAGVVTMFPLAPGSSPLGITVGADGALWFVENISNKIGRITIAGVSTEFPLPNAGSGLQEIVKGPDGALWFTERNRGVIGRGALPAGVFPPSIAAAFGAATIALNGSTTLSFTINNPNPAALSGVAFTDSLPAGLSVATPNGLTGSCGTGIAAAGTSISLSGGTIAAGGSCTFSVNIVGVGAGTQVTTTSAVTSANSASGNSASATLTVAGAQPPDLTVSVSHGAGFAQGQTGAAFTITVTNSGTGPTTGSVSATGKPAAGLTATAIAGSGWSCTLPNLTCTRADTLAAGSSYSPIAVTVNVANNAPALATNTATVAGGGELNTANNSGSDLTVIQAVAFASVTTSPAGLTFSVDGAAFTSPQSLSPGTSHTIAAKSPQLGSSGGQFVFRSWSDGGGLSHTVTAAASAAYVANFDAQYPLTVAVSPAGAGTVTPGDGLFTAGSTVNLQATAASGFKFVSWSGPVNAADSAATSLTMTGAVTVTANFAAAQPVASTAVTTSPAGLSFSVDGIIYANPQSLAAGSTHTIAARSPQPGASGVQYVFKSWSDGGALAHTVTVPATSTTYTASFETQYQLTVTVSPAGSGTVTPAGGFYTAGSLVGLQATPAAGFSFAGWVGNVGGAATGIVAMSGPQSVTANFKANPGAQTIDFPPLPNRTQGDLPFALTAAASSGLPVTFAILSGPATISGNTLTLTGTGTVAVQASQGGNAKFTAATPVTRSFSVLAAGAALTLAANPPDGGTVAATPAAGLVTAGTTVRLEAQANPGFLFTGFSGAVSGLGNPQSFLVPQASTVTANFARISTDPQDQVTFAVTRGNPLPGGQTVPLGSAAAGSSVLVIPGTGGDWLVAVPGAADLASALLSLNSATASNLTSGTYVSYVLAPSAAGQRVLTVKLMVDVVAITGVLDAAGFRGPSLASQELATAFGFNQAVGARLAAALPLDSTLGGTTLTITDAAGVSRGGQLLYVSSTQVNFVTPAGMAPGPGTLAIENSTGQKGTVPVVIETAAPGLFSADQNGKGTVAAVVQRFAASGTVATSLAANCDGSGPCSPVAIDLSNATDQVFLSLYGTGIRGASGLAGVSVTIGGVPVEVLFAGAQPQFPGLDQVNVKLSPSLAGKGDAAVNVTVDGHAANPVSIRIR